MTDKKKDKKVKHNFSYHPDHPHTQHKITWISTVFAKIN